MHHSGRRTFTFSGPATPALRRAPPREHVKCRAGAARALSAAEEGTELPGARTAREEVVVQTGDVAERGVVREFHVDEGWGIIDGRSVPGGCWVHFSTIAAHRQVKRNRDKPSDEERATKTCELGSAGCRFPHW